MIPYTRTDTKLIVNLDGQSHFIPRPSQQYDLAIEAIRENDLDSLEQVINTQAALSTFSDGRITVNDNGEVFYDGNQVHSTLARRIQEFFQEGLDFKPLVAFMANLMENPSFRSVEELYGFLENEGLAITEDGCFVGYKSVRDDYTDIYSGRFDNSPGQVHEMSRNLVDDDARRHCSNGFHIGSQRYAESFGGGGSRMMLVKVNPRDAVSVPNDGAEKLRACRYEVLREVPKTTILQSAMYDPEDFEDEDNYEDDICDNCSYPYEWCDCDGF